MRVSYTQLSTYKQCPRKYKFYIDRAPQDPSRTLALRFGSAVHKALEFAYGARGQAPPSLERVLSYYRKLMEEESDPKVREWFARGITAIEEYVTVNDPRQKHVLGVEQKFSMSLGDAHQMVGVIDRLDMLPDGSFEILDYKTGQIANAEKLGENWQLAIYQMVKGQHLQTDRITVSLVFIMHQAHKLSYHFTQEELGRLREEMLQQIGVIERDAVFPTRVSSWCGTCPYQPICPAWTHKETFSRVLTGKERDEELRDVQAKVDKLLQVTAAAKRLENEAQALKEALAAYARERNLTRLFSDLGMVSFSFRRRARYDVSRLVEVLRADILAKIVKTVDARKLEKALPYLSPQERESIEGLRQEEESSSVTVRPRVGDETEELLSP